MTRLFIALPVEGEVRTLLEPTYRFLTGHDHILKAVATDNYHITVKFLGECDGNIASAIESTFLEIPVTAGEIPYEMAGLGSFPDLRKPTVLWAGLSVDGARLAGIRSSVEKYASRFRFKEEKRDFVPHLTIARVKSGRKVSGDLLKYIESNKETSYGHSIFNRLSLFSSRLTPEGPVYKELKSISF
jgi:RNA 2',3'-cyclic 3'-phosphodiesterase